ncbi:hypothetical protein [Nitrosopumilus sp.]|uniref:hypothetical protein n=1 Tax=Nitrosopumilus sp. TaxID=2024843 RepID=UPI00292E6E03|nr:hypothetical protein [Nitrosopumilus sp.]
MILLSEAKAASGSDNPNLFVSAENSQFDNHFAGSMVVEVVIRDNNIRDTDEGKGEPDVTLNGKTLRMVQASDGNWYAYFANVDAAKTADSTVGAPGQGLDFGVFCDRDTNVFGIDLSESDGFFVPRSDCIGSLGSDMNNVVRNPRSINTNPAVPPGQIGLDEDAWPLIQLFSFDDVTIQYNAAGGAQQADLEYDEIPNISLSLDRDLYARNAEVFATINDFQLNQDPTDEDSWTFSIGSPTATFYQAFDNSGRPSAAGTDGLVDLVPHLSDLDFENNGVLSMDLNSVIELKPNSHQNNDSFVEDGSSNPFNQIVTVVEMGPNSGIFESFDSGDESVIGILADASRGKAGTMEYNDESISILTGFSTGSVALQEEEKDKRDLSSNNSGGSSSSSIPQLSATEISLPSEGLTNEIVLSGSIEDQKRGVPLSLTMRHPDGNTQELSAGVTANGNYKEVFTINPDSLTGTYQIELDYGGSDMGSVSFDVLGLEELEDMIEVGDEMITQNSQDINSASDTSGFGATVKLDKEVYSWTDKVYITVDSPFHNLDSDAVDEIGTTKPYTIQIRSNQFSLDNYKLVETDVNTGIFAGEVILTGFLHDADGNAATGYADGVGDDINPVTSGSGPVNGLLQSDIGDGLYVQFDYSEDVTIVGSALIRWNIGEVQWLEDSYPSTGTGVVQVIDPDMNWDPKAVDNFDVDVWSDSDAGGVDLTVTETDDATGIFEGTVFFSITDESSGHRLRVAEGDAITAEYEDNTLPDPHTIEDELDVIDTAAVIATPSTAGEMTPMEDVSEETLLPPTKQMRNGVLPSNVICDEPLEKIFRPSGHAAACVKASSIDKLTERGWSIFVS